MLATALSLAATLSQLTGYAWSALSPERVSLTLSNGWEHSVWVGSTTVEQATVSALQFIRTYGS